MLLKELNMILEGYKNLFDPKDKEKYAEEAYAQLQKAYAKIGGIHGSGFKNPEDFVKNIPFWKLRFGPDKKLIAGAYYKDRDGRKLVAISSDGSDEGKKIVADIMISDMLQGRSMAEVSSSALKFIVKLAGYDAVKKFAFPFEKVKKEEGDAVSKPPSDDPEIKLHPELKDFFYQRNIGGELHTKLKVGTSGKKIT